MHVLVLGDTHFPFADKKVLAALFRQQTALEAANPFTHIVQVGDLYDFYSFSKYPATRDLMTPTEEIQKGRAEAEALWLKVQAISPSAKCFQLKGNHDERLKKRLMEKMPEVASIVNSEHLWEFLGVETLPDQRTELEIGSVVFIHGHYGRPGQHLAFNNANTVHGHTHKGSVTYKTVQGQILWELDAGCLADLSSPPMSYSSQRKYSLMQNGFGTIDKYGPRYIPLCGGKLWK
jgi:predicted phosphodiesterase